jgi:hypothetical protein
MKSQAWQDIAHGNAKAVTDAIAEDACYAQMRAADGRGPLFWAHEFFNQKIIDALVGWALFTTLFFAVKTPVDDGRYGPVTNMTPPISDNQDTSRCQPVTVHVTNLTPRSGNQGTS